MYQESGMWRRGKGKFEVHRFVSGVVQEIEYHAYIARFICFHQRWQTSQRNIFSYCSVMNSLWSSVIRMVDPSASVLLTVTPSLNKDCWPVV